MGLTAEPAFDLNLSSPFSFKRPIAQRGLALNVSDSVQPGGRMLWCLRRRTSDVRCIMYPNGIPVEVRVLQDRDVVLTELFQEEWLALNWAQAYADRLKKQGWHDSPAGRY
jgi:hypothetical protein